MSKVSRVAITEAQIAVVEHLLQSLTPEQIIKGHHDLHRPLMHVLFKANTCAAIAELFTQCGHEMSRQNVHRILHQNPDLIVKQQRTKIGVSSPLAPEKEREIIRLFKDGATITGMAKTLHTSATRINEVLEKHGFSKYDRMVASRQVQIGDRFGNWEVIGYVSSSTSLCRDVRNGVEKPVADQALRLGKSTGCRELGITGWAAKSG